MAHLLHKEVRLWHIETTLSVSTKQKQQSNQQIEKIATIKETKTERFSETVISVNDDCQGRELKQSKLRENETYPQVWFSFSRRLDAIAFYIQDSLLRGTGMH